MRQPQGNGEMAVREEENALTGVGGSYREHRRR